MKRGDRALVTGASSGIGKAFAEQLGQAGLDLLLTARRRDRLEAVASAIVKSAHVQVDVLEADLRDPGVPERIVQGLASRPIDVLVNNAGIGVAEHFAQLPWQRHAEFIQLMVTSVVHLTHLCLPGMIERRRGHIVQVASLAGLLPGAPTNTLYAAAKAFLVRFSESLSAELAGTGVQVTAVCPGLTHSEFHDTMGPSARLQRVPEAAWQTADEVAREAIAAMARGSVVCVTGRLNRWIESLARHVPQRAVRSTMRQGR
jgi:short-subunit dehydrogenase